MDLLFAAIKGTVPLWKIFWLGGALLAVLMGLGITTNNIFIALGVAWIFGVLWLICLWNCAPNTGHAAWLYITRTAIVALPCILFLLSMLPSHTLGR